MNWVTPISAAAPMARITTPATSIGEIDFRSATTADADACETSGGAGGMTPLAVCGTVSCEPLTVAAAYAPLAAVIRRDPESRLSRWRSARMSAAD
jgi:hypothetical protein